jgi:VIT1/CCC1 family predicted Fe2+/Mn2+ transporter
VKNAGDGHAATAGTGRGDAVLAEMLANWRVEMEGAATFRDLASFEADERRRDVLNNLAAAEDRHAALWADRIMALGGADPRLGPKPHPSRRVALVARTGGIDRALRLVEDDERADLVHYQKQLSKLGDAESDSIIDTLMTDGDEHVRTVHDLTRQEVDPKSRLNTILRRERWHSTSGNWIGDAIYGVNDGLTAVFGIVSGVAGFAGGGEIVVVAGLAGMVASALSMGASAYLANKSEREVFEAEISRERRELTEHPEEEREEMELFYQLKGFSEPEARKMADRLSERPEEMLRTLVQEELGLSEDRLPNPVKSAVVGTLSTGLGAVIPVLPFLLATGQDALVASALVSILAHFGVGAAKSLVTLRSWWRSGLEMTAVAVVVAVVTYLVGYLLSI